MLVTLKHAIERLGNEFGTHRACVAISDNQKELITEIRGVNMVNGERLKQLIVDLREPGTANAGSKHPKAIQEDSTELKSFIKDVISMRYKDFDDSKIDRFISDKFKSKTI